MSFPCEISDRSVAYVRGVGDEIPHAMRSLGIAFESLEAADLAEGDLSRFDTIILGCAR